MTNVNLLGGSALAHHFHLFFSFLLITAFVLIVVWAIRFAKKDDLKNWIIGLVVVGLIGWLLTASASPFGWGRYDKLGNSPVSFGPGMMMAPGMLECAQDEECHEEVEGVMHRMMGIEEEE